MKNLSFLLLSCFVFLSLVACQSGNKDAPATVTPAACTTTYQYGQPVSSCGGAGAYNNGQYGAGGYSGAGAYGAQNPCLVYGPSFTPQMVPGQGMMCVSPY